MYVKYIFKHHFLNIKKVFTMFLVVDFKFCRLFSICFSVILVDKVSVLRVSRVISRKLKSIFL